MHVFLHVACKPLSANKQILNIYCRHSQTAFPRRFKTALRRHVVPTPWIPAPTRLSNAEPGNPSGTNPAIPEEGNTRPAPPYNDSGTNRVPANSKLPTRAGPGLAGPGRPVPSRPDRVLPHPEAQEKAAPSNRTAPPPEPTRIRSRLLRAELRPHPAAAPLTPQGETERRRVPTGRQRRRAGRGSGARPSSAPAGPPRTWQRDLLLLLLLLHPPLVRRTPLRFRRPTKAPAADRQQPTAGAEGQTSSESVAGCAGTSRHCGRTGRPVQERPTRSHRQGERSERNWRGKRGGAGVLPET